MFKNSKVSDNNNNNSLFHQIFLSTHTLKNNGKKKLVMLCQRPLSD